MVNLHLCQCYIIHVFAVAVEYSLAVTFYLLDMVYGCLRAFGTSGRPGACRLRYIITQPQPCASAYSVANQTPP